MIRRDFLRGEIKCTKKSGCNQYLGENIEFGLFISPAPLRHVTFYGWSVL